MTDVDDARRKRHPIPDGEPCQAPTAADLRRIASSLQPQDIVLGATGRHGAQVLADISIAIGLRCGLQATLVFDALWRREQAGSTALGRGFAIPHARVRGIDRPATFYVRPAQPLGFGAADGQPVSDILVILVPSSDDDAAANADHLQLLALVGQVAGDTAFRGELRSADDAVSVAAAFTVAIERAVVASASG